MVRGTGNHRATLRFSAVAARGPGGGAGDSCRTKSGQYDWSANGLEDGEKHLHQVLFMLPRRAFASPADEAEFLRMARERTGTVRGTLFEWPWVDDRPPGPV
jgi:hypothetical protein